MGRVAVAGDRQRRFINIKVRHKVVEHKVVDEAVDRRKQPIVRGIIISASAVRKNAPCIGDPDVLQIKVHVRTP